MRFVSANEGKVIKEYGLLRERLPRSYTIHTPILADRDIIRDRNNKIYEILDVTKHYYRGALITHQDFSMREIDLLDKSYLNEQLKAPGVLP